MKARQTREVRIGNVTIGANHPIAVQSMTATKTQDIAATIRQVELLEAAGADVIRIAIDTPKDVTALAEVRAARPNANLVIDLQENYRLAETRRAVRAEAPLQPRPPLPHRARQADRATKSRYLVDVARAHGCAMRIGVNAGSVDPEKLDKYPKDDSISPMIDSALEHCLMLDDLGFDQYVVSLKDSDPNKVIDANIRFAEARPDVPLHLGVTEAGMPPDGIIKTRVAFEQLITRGIGDTHPRLAHAAVREQGRRDHRRPPDPRRHRQRPLPLRRPLRTEGAEHHQLPLLLARRERGVHRSRAEREGDDDVREGARHHDRGDGLPRERTRRDRRRRPRHVVRAELREPEARRGVARPVTPTTRSSAACARSSIS